MLSIITTWAWLLEISSHCEKVKWSSESSSWCASVILLRFGRACQSAFTQDRPSKLPYWGNDTTFQIWILVMVLRDLYRRSVPCTDQLTSKYGLFHIPYNAAVWSVVQKRIPLLSKRKFCRFTYDYIWENVLVVDCVNLSRTHNDWKPQQKCGCSCKSNPSRGEFFGNYFSCHGITFIW